MNKQDKLNEQKPVPFNDALKRVWAAPLAPKVAKPAAKKVSAKKK